MSDETKVYEEYPGHWPPDAVTVVDQAIERAEDAEARVAELEAALADLYAVYQKSSYGPCRASRTAEALLATRTTDASGNGQGGGS